MAVRNPLRPGHRVKPKGSILENLINPIDRLSETIFSILIMLFFTLVYRVNQYPSFRFYENQETIISNMILGALITVITWGFFDGVMYALFSLLERSEKHRLLKGIQSAMDDASAVEVIADELDYILEPITEEAQRSSLYQNILGFLRTSKPQIINFKREDFTAILGHVLVAVIAIIPSMIPLVVFRQNAELAIRSSNIVSFAVLFLSGFQWGKYTGVAPWKTGILITAVGVLTVVIGILLGG